MADILGPLIPERLRTQRLMLRRPEPCDLEPYVSFYASQRSTMVLGRWTARRLSSRSAWKWLFGTSRGSAITSYCATRSRSDWPVSGILKAGTRPRSAGFCGRAMRAGATPPKRPRRLRDFLEELSWPPPVSYIDPANHRSKAVARRLGARFERHRPRWPDTEIWRHRAGVAPAP